MGWGGERGHRLRKGEQSRKWAQVVESLARGRDLNGIRDIGGWREPHWVRGQRLVKSSRNGKGLNCSGLLWVREGIRVERGRGPL